MIELEESVRLAKEELARIDAELWKLHEEHREDIVRERARHEDRLRDLGERFFYQKEPLEKHREAIVKRLVDVECMKAPQPFVVEDEKLRRSAEKMFRAAATAFPDYKD